MLNRTHAIQIALYQLSTTLKLWSRADGNDTLFAETAEYLMIDIANNVNQTPALRSNPAFAYFARPAHCFEMPTREGINDLFQTVSNIVDIL